jgi:predicted nucleic acid-binding protein
VSVVVDASIGIQWVVREAGSARAVKLLDRSPIVPGLFFAECANILWKKVERKELSSDAACERGRALATVRLDVVSDADLFTEALALACELRHPAYDCIYIAAARLRSALLVTADLRLIEHCRTARQPWLRKQVVALDSL